MASKFRLYGMVLQFLRFEAHGHMIRNQDFKEVVNPTRIVRSLLGTDKFVPDVTSLNDQFPSTQQQDKIFSRIQWLYPHTVHGLTHSFGPMN